MQNDMSGSAFDKLYENPAILMESARLQTKRGDTMNADNFFLRVMRSLLSQVSAITIIQTLGSRGQLVGQ